MNAKLTVNGQVHELEIEPHETLAQVLRNKLGLHGVRVSCTEGECGSCTVLMNGEPVTSCLMLALQAEGKEITTIEGLGTEADLHPIQKAFIEERAVQCGFCTSGMIMAAKSLLDRNPDPTDPEIKAVTRHRFRQLSQLIPVFKPKTVVCHTGWDYKRYWNMKEIWIGNSLELWGWFSDLVKSEGALLMLENVYEDNPHEFLDLYQNLKECIVT